MKRFFAGMGCIGLGLAVGCSTVTEVGTAIGQGAGVISQQQADSINRSAKAVEKTFKDITPEQEYYIGRAVAASILTQYSVVDDPALNRYVNQLGQALALASDKPQTFRGYHFLILDSEEVNAFACPGGLILVSRGIVELCTSEDELAAVLAHEIGHVQFEHGLKAIKKSRLTGALTILAAEGARNFGGEQVASLTDSLEGGISDITATMVNSGYARKLEFEADEAAVTILTRVGYPTGSLIAMLQNMSVRLSGDHSGFGATHPPADVRIQRLTKTLGTVEKENPPSARQKRFEKATKGLASSS